MDLKTQKTYKSINEIELPDDKDLQKVLFILQKCGPTPSEQIIMKIWPEVDYFQAQKKLYNIIHKLKAEGVEIVNNKGSYYITSKAA